MHDPSRVRISGPLEVFAAGFAAELGRLGYRRTPASFQLQLMAHVSRWLEGEGLGADGLTSEVVERFLAERRAAGYTDRVTLAGDGAAAGVSARAWCRAAGVAACGGRRGRGAACRLPRVLGWSSAGLTADTIEGYVLAVRPFLAGRGREGDELDLGGLSAADVDGVRGRSLPAAVARARRR